MVNEQYEPNDREQRIVDFISEEPGGRVTNRYVREELNMAAERVDPALNNLKKAGWLRRLTRGFYELVADPRTD
jgi:hypothetical protein